MYEKKYSRWDIIIFFLDLLTILVAYPFCICFSIILLCNAHYIVGIIYGIFVLNLFLNNPTITNKNNLISMYTLNDGV